MYGATQYIREFGNISMESMPFSDADNIAICGVLYMPVEYVVTSEFEKKPELTVGEACDKLFEYYGRKHVAQGLFLNKELSKRFVELGKYPRFAELGITGCQGVFNAENAVQFAGMTIILPDGTLYVVFRGTDDSFAGWKEDIDLYVKHGIPSHKLAVEYLENVAKNYDGNIILAGHSKGGNVALYAAVNCSEEVRNRIVKVYNNEGPGFDDYSMFSTPAYKELLPRYKHIVPSASFVGMLLAHDDDYTVVKSSKLIGPMQHDIGTWQLKGCELDTLPELDRLGKINEKSFKRILSDFTDEQVEAFYKVVCSTVEATGQTCLKGFAQVLVPSVVKMVDCWNKIDDSTKKAAKMTFRSFREAFVSSHNEVVGRVGDRLKTATAK